jgi:hypothetical protein
MPVSLDEGVDIAFVPAKLLIGNELRDRGPVFGVRIRGGLGASPSGGKC